MKTRGAVAGGVVVPPVVGAGRDTRARRAAREALAAVLWDDAGQRLLPTEAALVSALEACDARDVWWVCEASSAGPVYLLPTVEWINALAAYITTLGAKTVLEVAAGDGFLAACLAKAAPALTVTATDNHRWSKPTARMNEEDRAAYEGVSFAGIAMGATVEKRDAVEAVTAMKPDLVLVSWAPPGRLVEKVVCAPSSLVLELGAEGGVTGDDARMWRYNKDFVEGEVESRALCRLDARPSEGRATRATLYYGKLHPEHGRE